MPGNTFGHLLRLTTFGESHGLSIGGIVDGVPPGLELCEKDLQRELDLRKPGQGSTSTARKEADLVHIQSGLFQGKTTGTPIAFLIENTNQQSSDYDELARVFRPGHADFTYHTKYHGFRDYRGGGRASGRETAARVAAGAIAAKILAQISVEIFAASVEFGGIGIDNEFVDLAGALARPYFAASDSVISRWDQAVQKARENHDTLGGIVQIEANNVPAGLGEPVFDKISAMLGHGLLSVGAVKGVEFGDGFQAARSTGSANNDLLLAPKSAGALPGFATNHAGGMLGGITTGQSIIARVAVKPIASVPRPQQTVDLDGHPCQITIGGRHDLSAIPRIVPVLRAMTALVLADAWLMQNSLG
ncbi:MAG: chorismate synthase [Desulfovibrio sp.]|nr:chorismate synthase [Desulfovibrio sp.]